MNLEIFITLALVSFILFLAGTLKRDLFLLASAAILLGVLAPSSLDIDYVDCVNQPISIIENTSKINFTETNVTSNIDCELYKLRYDELAYIFGFMAVISLIFLIIFMIVNFTDGGNKKNGN